MVPFSNDRNTKTQSLSSTFWYLEADGRCAKGLWGDVPRSCSFAKQASLLAALQEISTNHRTHK
jgi:hypothetical protein